MGDTWLAMKTLIPLCVLPDESVLAPGRGCRTDTIGRTRASAVVLGQPLALIETPVGYYMLTSESEVTTS